MIETFFSRMLDLPLQTRAAVAYQMVTQMTAKMGVGVAGGKSGAGAGVDGVPDEKRWAASLIG